VNPPPAVRLRPLTLFWLGSLLATLMLLETLRRGRVQSRGPWAAASLLIVMMLLGALTGCSSVPGTPPSTYTVNVQITDGNFNLVVPFPVVVRK
jgi:hypothetical protein